MTEKKDTKRKSHFYDFIPEEAVEHAKAARTELRKSYGSFFPPEFIAGHQAARKEMLLAAREFINHAIDRIETQKKH